MRPRLASYKLKVASTIKTNKNASTANVVAIRPVFDFLPMFVYYTHCIASRGGRWQQITICGKQFPF
jgi:hypothetical protein